MADAFVNRAALLVAAANRLRAIQVDFADEDPATREQYLVAEVKRSLEQVLPQDRAAFLEELRARFPTWDPKANGQALPAAAPPAAPEPQDPASLARRLISALGAAPEAQKREVAQLLQEAGLQPTPGGGGAVPEAAAQKVRALLGLPATDPIDPARLAEAAAALIDLATNLEPIVWKVLNKIDPGAAPRSKNLQASLRAFITGDKDQPVLKDVNELKKRAALIVNSIKELGSTLYHMHLNCFSVNEIKQAAEAKPKSMLIGWEVHYWKEFVGLSAKLEEAAIDRAVLAAVKEYVRVYT